MHGLEARNISTPRAKRKPFHQEKLKDFKPLSKKPSSPPSSRKGKGKTRGKRRFSDRTEGKADHWLFGAHAVEAALANPNRQIQRLLATARAAESLKNPESHLSKSQPIEICTSEEISAVLSPGAVHQGLALEAAPLAQPPLDQVLAKASQISASLVFLDQVTDPHNVGAIMRSAAAFGAAAVVVQDRHAPPITGTLAKSASGAAEVIALVRVTNLSRAMDEVIEAGYFCIGLAGDAEESFQNFDFPDKVALILGAEGPGLRRLTREKCDMLLHLPTEEPISSLNVSNAAAVALYAIATR